MIIIFQKWLDSFIKCYLPIQFEFWVVEVGVVKVEVETVQVTREGVVVNQLKELDVELDLVVDVVVVVVEVVEVVDEDVESIGVVLWPITTEQLGP